MDFVRFSFRDTIRIAPTDLFVHSCQLFDFRLGDHLLTAGKARSDALLLANDTATVQTVADELMNGRLTVTHLSACGFHGSKNKFIII